MSRRAASVTQADVRRVIRAARQEGACRVTVKVCGAEIAVDLEKPGDVPPLSTGQAVEPKRRIAL